MCFLPRNADGVLKLTNNVPTTQREQQDKDNNSAPNNPGRGLSPGRKNLFERLELTPESGKNVARVMGSKVFGRQGFACHKDVKGSLGISGSAFQKVEEVQKRSNLFEEIDIKRMKLCTFGKYPKIPDCFFSGSFFF